MRERRSNVYQRPTLSIIGKAEQVVLGIFSIGDDLDGQIYPAELQFIEDDNEPERPKP